MTTSVLVDTGPIVAILSKPDAHHKSCCAQLKKIKGPLVTCWPVLTEAAWHLRSSAGAVESLLSSVTSGVFMLAALDSTDLPGIQTVLNKYSNLSLQLADAALLYLANRENIRTIFTLDRRDFNAVRPAKGSFILIP